MQEKRSSIISVRVHDEIKKKLILESEMESLTLNTLIGKILTKHIEWDQFADEVGMVMVTRPFLRAILELLSDDDIKKLAVTQCRSAFQDAVIFTTGDLTIINLLKTLELWLNSSHIPFRRIMKGDSDKFIIQHELGENGHFIFLLLLAHCSMLSIIKSWI